MADDIIQAGLGGFGIGAKLGSMIMPGIGTAIGGFLGGGLGLIGAKNKKKAIDAATNIFAAIPKVDPNMIEFKDQLMAEKRAVTSGFGTDFQVARDIISESQAGGMSVAAEIAQTNPALALIMMNQTSMQADTSLNKALGTISTQKMGYTQLISDYVDKISQRKLDLQMLEATQKMATLTATQKDANANRMAGITQLFDPSVGAGFKDFFSLFGNKGGAGVSGAPSD